jgi:hypothetical protein
MPSHFESSLVARVKWFQKGVYMHTHNSHDRRRSKEVSRQIAQAVG